MNINIPGIDTQQAIKNSGSMEMFMELLTDVYKLIDDKSDQVEAYLNEKDISRYTVLVHSLKTTCQMIGAMDLREQFYTLEMLGKENQLEQIQELTPAVLNSFRDLKPYLAPYASSTNEATLAYDRNAVSEYLHKLISAMDDFALDEAEAAINALLAYNYDDTIGNQIHKLEGLVANLDYDEARDLATEILKAI